MAKRDESVEKTLDQIPDEQIYLESDDPWAPKMLDLEGTLVMLGLIGDVIDDISETDEDEGFKVASLIRSLKKETLLQLIALATKQSLQWVEDNFFFPKAVKSLMAFFKMNELGALLGALGLGLGGGTQEEEEEEEES